MAFFARVVEARSFSDAARSLGVSKSAVSTRVARLEEKLGVKLLHRTTRRLALTADGVRLYERCARVVAEADLAAEVAEQASDVPRGTVRVHASTSLARPFLASLIGEFARLYPQVKVELGVGDHVPDLASGRIDVALVVARQLADSSLSSRKLASLGVVVCAAPSYLRARGIPFRPQDLVLHTCLSHALQRGEDWHFNTDEGPVSLADLSALVVDDARFLRDAALEGLGVAMLPEPMVAGDLAEGRLHRLLDDFHAIELSVHALHPHSRLPPAAVRALLDHLAACFRRPRRPPQGHAAAGPAAAAPRRAGGAIAMTEQDVRRLGAVAALYDGVDAEGSARLRELLARVKPTLASKIPRNVVTMNSRVRGRYAPGDERELSLVYPWDEARDRASVLGPLGASLLGATTGSVIADGDRKLTITSIPYQPEAAGDNHL